MKVVESQVQLKVAIGVNWDRSTSINWTSLSLFSSGQIIVKKQVDAWY